MTGTLAYLRRCWPARPERRAAAGSMTGVAHHAISAKFDDKKPTTMNGVVTLVDWRNPHVHVFMNVKDAKGAILNWAVEIESPIDLRIERVEQRHAAAR